MQDAVSSNLLQAMLGSKTPQSGASLVQGPDPTVNNEATRDFDQLVAEQFNAQYLASFIDPSGGSSIPRQQAQLSPDALVGNNLPAGNRDTAILQSMLAKQLKALQPEKFAQDGPLFPDELAGVKSVPGSLATDEQLALLNKQSGKGQTNALLDAAEEIKAYKDLFLQQANKNKPLVTEVASDSSTLNKSFLNLLEAGTGQLGQQIQNTVNPADLTAKSLLNSFTNDSQLAEPGRVDVGTILQNSVNASDSKPVLNMSVPLSSSPAWQQSFGEKIMYMINQNMQGAEIKLNPPELGPLEVKLSMKQDQATILFSSNNQQVREILESALPRLREMLGDSGLNLANVDVSDKSLAHKENSAFFASDQQDEASAQTEKQGNDDDIAQQLIVQQLSSELPPGRIDFYA